MARDIIGPALPPGFQDSDEQDESEQVAGPVLPPGYKFESNSSDSSDNSNQESILETYKQHESSKSERKNRKQGLAEVAIAENETDFFGPALPPGFKRQDDSPQRPIIGPALPPGFRRDSENEDVSDYTFQCQEKKSDESSEDEDTIGPSPASGPVESTVTADIERRAWKMKQKLTEKDDGSNNPIRETWMTELPPELTNYGLGPRTFKRRTNDKSGDRSVWTDTPADREKKAKEKHEAKVSSSMADEKDQMSERDKRLAEQVSTYNDSRRSESLIDLHRKKLKRKAEEDKNKPQERRPFDRDQDLQVNRFDDAQKKALLRKSKELNTKFSYGNSMFL